MEHDTETRGRGVSLHPEVQALLKALRDLQRHLQQHDELFWSAHVEKAADEVARSDSFSVSRFLGLFGGMGSPNDLVLHANGTPFQSENDQFDALRSHAWELAWLLRHEAG